MFDTTGAGRRASLGHDLDAVLSSVLVGHFKDDEIGDELVEVWLGVEDTAVPARENGSAKVSECLHSPARKHLGYRNVHLQLRKLKTLGLKNEAFYWHWHAS